MIARKHKNPRRKMTAAEREDARDAAIIRHESKKPTYSFRAFVKTLGYEIETRKRRRAA